MVNQPGIAGATLDTASIADPMNKKAASQHVCPFHNILEDRVNAFG